MKTRKNLAYFALFACLVSCSDDIGISQDEPLQKQEAEKSLELSSHEVMVLKEMANGTTVLDQQEAANIALSIFGNPQGTNKSSIYRTIKNVEVITSDGEGGNKSVDGENETDTLMYVFNFENNGGYSVVSADIRVDQPILAYSTSGELEVGGNEMVDENFFELAKFYINEQIEEAEARHDSLLEVVTEKVLSMYEDSLQAEEISSGNKAVTIVQKYLLTNQCYTKYTYTITANVDPLLKTEWSQDMPYNDKVAKRYKEKNGCSLFDAYNVPVGCVPVAVAQIMAYWQYPNSIQGYDGTINFNWQKIKDVRTLLSYNDYSISEQIKYLLSYVGEGMNVSYAMNASSTTFSKAQKYLNKLGYKTSIENYSYERVVSYLKEKHPVCVSGLDAKTDTAHAWTADGYIENTVRRQDDLTYVVITSNTVNYGEPPLFVKETVVSTQNAKYLHINWGWGVEEDAGDLYDLKKGCNGYYLKDVFRVSDRYVRDPNNSAKLNIERNTKNKNYSEKLQILNIYR